MVKLLGGFAVVILLIVVIGTLLFLSSSSAIAADAEQDLNSAATADATALDTCAGTSKNVARQVAASDVLTGSDTSRIQEHVDNAVRHNDSESPRVEISGRRNDARRGNWIDVSVVDDGPGLPQDEKQVTEMDATATQLSHGSGMGLWTVSQATRAFGGEMSIESRDGDGTTVTLHLKESNASDANAVVA
jgi:signal transduction histidine kinase